MSGQPSSRRAALRSRFCLGVLVLLGALTSVRGVTITEAEHEGRAQFKVVTASATYLFDRAGGGFSRLIDRDGKDWISFRKEPLKEVPASAAAGFRGIPNSVFGKDNPDAGAGHPGFDRCESALAGGDTIRTVSKSGRWAWKWRFTETNAVFTMEKAPAEDAWWFLYEGTIGGRWSPRTHYWGTDTGGPRREVTDTKRQLFEQWRWAYFGDDQSPRVLLVAQMEKDELPDTLWFMGSTRAGLDAPDGMVVFGFGRGPGGKPQFRGAGQRFVLGLVEGAVKDAASHAQLAVVAGKWTPAAKPAARGPLRVHPTNPRYFADGSRNADGSLRAVYLAGSHIWQSFPDTGHRLESGAEPPPVFDFDAFLKLLDASGHNFTRFWRWELPKWTEGDTKTRQTEHSQPHPWQRAGPGLASDGKPRFDLTKFDDGYFERLRSRVKLAGEHGIYAAVMLFECWGVQHVTNAWQYHPLAGPNNVNGIEADEDGDGWGLESHSLRDSAMGRRVLAVQEAYVRKVLETLNGLDNVLYEIANEGGSYSAPWQNHMVGFVRRTEAGMPRQHLAGITFYYSRDRARRGSNEMLFQSVADWVSPSDGPAVGGNGFGFKANPPPDFQGKIIVADTDHLGWNAKRTEDWFWKQFCRGNHTWYLEWAYASPTEAVAARKGIGQTVAWSRKVNLAAMQPSTDAASTAYCLANPGREYLAFQPGRGGFTVDLRNSSATFSVEWFAPGTEASRSGETVRGGSVQSFTPPHDGPAVLHLKAKE
ncbi:MAG: hypothetical protein ABMA26_13765 [Limisphaerales bacterium]